MRPHLSNTQQLGSKHEQQLAEIDRLRRLNQWCAQKLREMGEIDADEYASRMLCLAIFFACLVESVLGRLFAFARLRSRTPVSIDAVAFSFEVSQRHVRQAGKIWGGGGHATVKMPTHRVDLKHHRFAPGLGMRARQGDRAEKRRHG